MAGFNIMKVNSIVTTASLIILALILVGCDSSSSTDSSEDIESISDLINTYPIADTAQAICYDNSTEVSCPTAIDDDFYGQDAQIDGNTQSYTENTSDDGDQTVSDDVTGIMWTKSPDLEGIGNNDGDITSDDKLSSSAGATACDELDHAGYSDWQLPSVKQLYSLMNFQGMDPENSGDETDFLVPFIDADVFDFAYGSTTDERIIDSQYATTSLYENDEGTEMMFGVNFADGRIKGYTEAFFNGDKTYFVLCMRDNTDYATNNFADNDDSTITDNATNLMWTQGDSGDGEAGFDYTSLDFTDADEDGLLVAASAEMYGAMTWQDAFTYVQEMNDENYLGYSDWRLPNIKELHSLVDYSKTPSTYDGATIDAVFNSTPIVNENGNTDYAFYWSGTTHATDGSIYSSDGIYGGQTDDYGDAGSYVTFGRALGYDSDDESEENDWIDVHGAGAQRSDAKVWDGGDYSEGSGPQYDAVRIYHYVRMVRDAD